MDGTSLTYNGDTLNVYGNMNVPQCEVDELVNKTETIGTLTSYPNGNEDADSYID